jgi:adhesin transport system outer membrane protein
VALGTGALWVGGLAMAEPLPLQAALRMAVSGHPSVVASRSERQASLMQLDAAERQRYPGLAVQSGTDAAGRRITTLRIDQPLWTGGRITGGIEVARATIRQSEAALQQAEQDIMLRVVTTYTELGRIEARQAAARENIREHERLVAMIDRRVASQVSPQSDGIQANARLSQARSELNQLDAQAFRARATLAQSTGTVVTAIEERLMPRAPWSGLEAALAAAVDFAPAMRRLGGELDAASAQIDVRRSSAYPQVSLRLDRSYGESAGGTRGYLALDYQTGAGFTVQAAIREAEARRDAIRSKIESARRETLDAVSGDWADLNALGAQTSNLQAQVSSTTAVFDSFVRQYAVGRKGWNDVLNAQREVAQARYQLADAQWGVLRAALRLDLMTGLITAQSLAETGPLQAVPLGVAREEKPLLDRKSTDGQTQMPDSPPGVSPQRH